MKLLFVCTGNTCRSPLAEAIARAEAASRGLDGVECRSAGTFAFEGQLAAGPGIVVAREHGLDLEGHRSRELSLELLEWADRVIGMDRAHVEAVRRIDPAAPASPVLEYLPPDDARHGAGVPDPFGGDLDTYARTYAVLEEAIRGLFDALEEPERPPSP